MGRDARRLLRAPRRGWRSPAAPVERRQLPPEHARLRGAEGSPGGLESGPVQAPTLRVAPDAPLTFLSGGSSLEFVQEAS